MYLINKPKQKKKKEAEIHPGLYTYLKYTANIMNHPNRPSMIISTAPALSHGVGEIHPSKNISRTMVGKIFSPESFTVWPEVDAWVAKIPKKSRY